MHINPCWQVSHPLTGKKLPVVVSKHVIADHAQGAVMGVAAHDSRDAAVARALNLETMPVLTPPDQKLMPEDEVYEGKGTLCNSAQFDGMSSDDAIGKILWLDGL